MIFTRQSIDHHWINRRELTVARLITVLMTLLFALMISQGRPDRLLTRAGFSSDFYDAQATAFLRGRLDVPAEIAGLEGFVIGGKTYIYFGPFLALMRIPFALFGTIFEGRLTRVSMILAFFLLCVLVIHLSVRVRQILGVKSDSSQCWRIGFLIAVVASSPVLALSGQPNVYNETELWALVLMLTTFNFGLLAFQSPTTKHVLFVSLAASATVLTRASVGFGALVMAVGVGILVWKKTRVLAGALWVSAGLALLIHVGVHRAKFGHWFDLPAEQQVLTLNDPARAAWFAANNNSFFDPSFVPTTLLHYLRPDAIAFERLFPFVRFGSPAMELTGELETYTPSSSLTVAASPLMILALAGLIIMVRNRFLYLLPLVLGGIIAAGPTLSIGFIAHRYLVDLLPIPIVLSIISMSVAWMRWSRLLKVGASVLVGWGLWVNLAFAMWLGSITTLGFTEFRYRLDNALFSSPPPSVVAVDSGVPRDGIVGIDGDCDGLYISVENRWQALELADGSRRMMGVFDPLSGPVVMEADSREHLRVTVVDNERIVVSYGVDNLTLIEGEPIEWSGETVSLDVVSDPVSGWVMRGLRVWVNGTLALTSLEAPDLSNLAPADGFKVSLRENEGTSVCEAISRRR